MVIAGRNTLLRRGDLTITRQYNKTCTRLLLFWYTSSTPCFYRYYSPLFLGETARARTRPWQQHTRTSVREARAGGGNKTRREKKIIIKIIVINGVSRGGRTATALMIMRPFFLFFFSRLVSLLHPSIPSRMTLCRSPSHRRAFPSTAPGRFTTFLSAFPPSH